MRAIIVAALVSAAPFIAQADSLDLPAAKKYCAATWVDDFEMQAYCLEEIIQGRQAAIEYKALNFRENLKIEASLDFCEEKWGVQWDMTSHCMSNQLQGYIDLIKHRQKVPADVARTILNHCFDEWRPQLDMVAFCADKQVKAWEILN